MHVSKIENRPKNREGGSDFDDFWTESIVSTQSFFSRISWNNFGSFRSFENFQKIDRDETIHLVQKSSKIRAILTIFRPFKDFYLD